MSVLQRSHMALNCLMLRSWSSDSWVLMVRRGVRVVGMMVGDGLFPLPSWVFTLVILCLVDGKSVILTTAAVLVVVVLVV